MSVSFGDHPGQEPEGALSGDQILGDDVHEWRSPDGRHVITFGRPRGLVSIKVARILGPQQAANPVLDVYYKALCSIRSWFIDGKDVGFMEPMTDMQFDGWFMRLGDDNLNGFVLAWQMSLYPEALAAMREAVEAGESPDTLARVGKNAGMAHSRKSRRANSSAKGSS